MILVHYGMTVIVKLIDSQLRSDSDPVHCTFKTLQCVLYCVGGDVKHCTIQFNSIQYMRQAIACLLYTSDAADE